MGTDEPKIYNLEERSLNYANRVADYVLKLPKNIPNIEYAHQLIRSSGSVGANYIEANECLGTKDFDMHIKISRKEAKESRYWLQLTRPVPDQEQEKQALMQESTEFLRIFSKMINNRKNGVL